MYGDRDGSEKGTGVRSVESRFIGVLGVSIVLFVEIFFRGLVE